MRITKYGQCPCVLFPYSRYQKFLGHAINWQRIDQHFYPQPSKRPILFLPFSYRCLVGGIEKNRDFFGAHVSERRVI
jgi:hypothetical protein